MIEIQSKWGAQYLTYDEPIELEKKNLLSRQGILLKVGDKVTKIGSKKRSNFELNNGFYMEYEGLLTIDKTTYAIFNCPDHNANADTNKQYRYAFGAIILNGDELSCFLICGNRGAADIQMDYLEIFDPAIHKRDEKKQKKSKKSHLSLQLSFF